MTQSPANICREQTLSSPPPSLLLQPPFSGEARVAWIARCALAQHHPSPNQGLKGSRRNSTDQLTPPQPSHPPFPSRVVGRSSQRARSQLLHSPHHCTHSRTAPTWADIVRGENFTQQEASAASPAETIALYKRYIAMGFQWRFSVNSSASYKEVSLFCRFLVLLAASYHSTQPLPNRRHQRRRHHQRNRGKPATCSASVQTEWFASTPPPCLHRPASPPPLA
jgi:hypothetical protein